MILKKLTLTNFRNYENIMVEFGEGIHFIIGKNGSGKTNLLESIYFLTYAKSYKASDISLVKNGEDYARLEAKFLIDERLFDARVLLNHEGKRILLNKVEQKRLSDYVGRFNIVSFLPEDSNLIVGSPRERRYFMDIYIGQMDRNYISELSKYKYILKQRNELLKSFQQSDDLSLDVLTEQLANAMQPIVDKRNKFIKELNQIIKIEYPKLSSKKESFELEYLPSIQDSIFTTIQAKKKTDLIYKITNYGAHRDDFDFLLNSNHASEYASKGEQRVMILTLVMSLYKMMESHYQIKPIILLDDVFSELDDEKQNKLIQFLLETKAQSIVTTTSINELNKNIINQVTIFNVQEGHIKEGKLK